MMSTQENLGRPDACVVGVDYGTLSGRAVVVRVRDGAELGSAVYEYPNAVITDRLPGTSRQLPPDWALQVPADYLGVLRNAVPQAVAAAGIEPSSVIGIGTDFTACTMVPTTSDGTPLCELPEYVDRPHAYVKLWRHHAAQPQADRINHSPKTAASHGSPATAASSPPNGNSPRVSNCWKATRRSTSGWTTGWRPRTGSSGSSAAGTSATPARPATRASCRTVATPTPTSWPHSIPTSPGSSPTSSITRSASWVSRPDGLTAQAAEWTGLPAGIAVVVGNVDAHVAAPAAASIAPGQLVAIMGTSTCHVMNGDELREVPGMCGVVNGGITAGRWGYEAGQSGVGDIFGWFVRTGVPAEYEQRAAAHGVTVHEYLTELAARQRVGEHGLLALDWHSGNRSVLVDHELSGLIVGQTLATKPEDTYRALLEATAFGTRTIIETFNAAGVPVTEMVVVGGLVKNALLMQIYADVTGLPLSLGGSEQGPALGSAIHAAVAAGAYPDVPAAAAVMGSRIDNVYLPDPANSAIYDEMYAEYRELHDYFGRGGNGLMRSLRQRRREATSGQVRV